MTPEEFFEPQWAGREGGGVGLFTGDPVPENAHI
jgi:hypothetical protein